MCFFKQRVLLNFTVFEFCKYLNVFKIFKRIVILAFFCDVYMRTIVLYYYDLPTELA